MEYRFVEHVGEVEIDVDAKSEPDVFGAALAAFAAPVELDGEGEPARHEVNLSAEDDALLLVDKSSAATAASSLPARSDVRLSASMIRRACSSSTSTKHTAISTHPNSPAATTR